MRDDPSIPTLREIAAHLGVSAMSVSRALRRDPSQRTPLQERIATAAAGFGYRPNPFVSALMSQRARQHGPRVRANLALLDPRSDDPSANKPYFQGCRRRAEELGYAGDYIPYEPAKISPARLRRILLARGVRGIVVGPVPEALTSLEFDFTGFSVATIGYSLAHPPMPRIVPDIQSMMMQGLRYLEECGYRRVGLVMAEDANRRMLCGYTGAAYSYGRFFARTLKVRTLMLANEKFTARLIRRVLRWREANGIEAIISSAGNLYSTLLAHGAKIPGEFAYLHLHRHTDPAVASMDQMREQIGAQVVEMVASMISHNQSWPMQGTQILLTPGQLAEGGTVPRRAGMTFQGFPLFPAGISPGKP